MKHFSLTLISLFALSFAVVGSSPSLAGPNPTPSPVIEVYGTPVDEPGLPLGWSVYEPAGTGPWPIVLVLHEGGFKSGSRNDAGVVLCAHDLAEAGYLALAVSYRLAPPGHLKGQEKYADDGRYLKQSADVQMAVLAARIDPRGNGQVGAIGGSAGGTHAAVAAINGRTGHDRVDVAVCLSGGYDFSDFRKDPRNEFKIDITNYVGARNPVTLLAASPISILDRKVSPLFLINTAHDIGMPVVQIGDMVAALQQLGATNFTSLTLPGDLHAFDYWETVKDQVLSFLAAGFADA